MNGRFIGHRGSGGNNWTWEPVQPGGDAPAGRGFLLRAAFLAAAVTGVVLVVAGVFIMASSGDGSGPVVTPPTASPTPDPTPPTPPPVITASPSPAPSPSPVPTPSPAPGPEFTVASWATQLAAWTPGALTAESSRLLEGSVMRFLIKVDDTEPGEVYRIAITYQCRAGDAAAIDYLATADVGGVVGLPADPLAPASGRPDSTIDMPADPGLPFDPVDDRAFALWGATFDSAPARPLPPGACIGSKTVTVAVRALADEVYLMFGGHLATSDDWGEGSGAASATVPFTIEVSIDGGPSQAITIAPGVVS